MRESAGCNNLYFVMYESQVEAYHKEIRFKINQKGISTFE